MKRSTRLTHVRQLALGAGLLGIGLLTGCGVALSTPAAGTNYNPPPHIQAQVNLGKGNLAYSKVTIYQTVNTGTANAQGRYTGTAKVLGTTTTDGGGVWQMPSDVKCSSPDMLYVVVTEGKPYMGFETFTKEPNNEKIMLMTAVGDCSVLDKTTAIFTNEATTVAAVNALAPFISVSGQTVNVVSSATNYTGASGVGTAASAAGLKHAFANANNLCPYDVGFFNTTTGSREVGKGGIISLPLVSTLAWIQALADMGSDAGGGDYTYRDALLNLTIPVGSTTPPATTLEAMMNIAQHNYPAANAVALYTLAQHRQPHTSSPAPDGAPAPTTTDPINIHPPYNRSNYWPLLTGVDDYPYNVATAPYGTILNNNFDWSVAIYYPQNYGETSTGQGLMYPLFVAIDNNDNVYVSNAVGSSSYKGNVIALDSTGSLLWTTDDDLDSYPSPRAIALDTQNHVFAVSNSATLPAVPAVTEWDATSGTLIKRIPTIAGAVGLTVDSHNNLWVAGASTTAGVAHLDELVNDGSDNFTKAVFAVPPVTAVLGQIQVDQNQNVWAASNVATSPNTIYMFPNTGTADAPAYAGTILANSIAGTVNYGVAIDKAGVAWSSPVASPAGSNNVYNMTVSGSGLTATIATTAVGNSPITNSRQGQMDGIGAYWAVENGTNYPLWRFKPGATVADPFLPCYADQTTYNPASTDASAGTTKTTNIQCTKTNNVATNANLGSKLDLAIDSTGAVWTTGAGQGYVTQILGVAAPVWPLRALGKNGIMP